MADKHIVTRVDQMIAELARTDEMERRLRKTDARQPAHSSDITSQRLDALLRWKERLTKQAA